MTSPTTPPSLSALLPCPFCGSTRGFDTGPGATHRWITVECVECGAGPGEIRKDADALAAWNTRLPAATQSGLCHDCENKKLREVMSAPRPDVSLGECKRPIADLLARLRDGKCNADDYYAVVEALNAKDALLACGHHNSLMLWSAETGLPLYCDLCDTRSARNDAEQTETELRAELAALRAQSPAEGGWISVEDRLPFEGQLIIGRNPQGGCWMEGYDSSEPIGAMTHWMDAQPAGENCEGIDPTAAPTAIALRESQAEGKSDEK